MKLKGFLYDAVALQCEGDAKVFEVRFKPGCDIYKGHFPGKPITPGVCLIQIAKELFEECVSQPLHLCEAKDIKFSSPVTPDRNPVVRYEISGTEEMRRSVLVYAGETLCCKMSLTFSTL